MKLTNIDKFALKCDEAINSKNITNIDTMLKELAELEIQYGENEVAIAHILYCTSNLYAAKARFSNEFIEDWRNNKFPENNILSLNYLRKALSKINEHSYPNNILEIHTNIGNTLNSFCRVIEANHFWTFNYNFTLPNDANFVASFAKAKTLNWLAQFLNDPGHSYYYNIEAYWLMKKLYSNRNSILHKEIKNDICNNSSIQELIKWGDKNNKYFESKSYDEISKNIHYKSKQELLYRKWCTKNTLFLNSMNDITNNLIAATDILQFSNYITEIGEGPFFSSAFSDIKNKYCKARYLFYCGLNKHYPKWLENELYMTDTFDCVDYSTNTENIKIAFRLCFSVLDSLAVLINKYFKINCDKDECSFASGWIRKNCAHIKNPFIDSIYWLSCDLTDISKIKNWKAPNPNASCLKILRNNLEHNWVRIAEYSHPFCSNKQDYANVITRYELEVATMAMFRYTRAAILYFTFAVTFQEKFVNTSDEIVVCMEAPIL